MEKIGLVLEGGGMRGAYTAGALTWLHDNNITFDYGVGISSGAVYLACYWMGDMHTLHNMPVNYAADSENVGLKAFQKEGYYVAYKHIFEDDLINKEHMDITPLKESNANIEVGAYDLEKGETIWFGPEDFDPQLTVLRGACSLPVASGIVEYKGHQLLDGGITKMIPIERAIEQGCTKELVITTKPASYERKPASKTICMLMKRIYKDCPQIEKDYRVRHLNYYKQMGIIAQEVKKGKAILVRPTKTIKMSRFKGDQVNCEKLFNLGYSDMEDLREEILAFLQK